MRSRPSSFFSGDAEGFHTQLAQPEVFSTMSHWLPEGGAEAPSGGRAACVKWRNRRSGQLAGASRRSCRKGEEPPGSDDLVGASRRSGGKGKKAPTSEELAAGASRHSRANRRRSHIIEDEKEVGDETENNDGVRCEGLIKEHLSTRTQARYFLRSVKPCLNKRISDTEMVLNKNMRDGGPALGGESEPFDEEMDLASDDEELELNNEPAVGDESNPLDEKIEFSYDVEEENSVSVSANKDLFWPQFGDFSEDQLRYLLQNLEPNYIAVKELDSKTVMSKIEKIMSLNADKIVEGNGFSYDIPKLGAKMLTFHKGIPQVVLKHEGTSLREFQKTIHMATATAFVLTTIHEVLKEGLTISNLVLFNLGKRLISEPKISSGILTDVCCMFECTGSSLNVVGLGSKGSVIGSLRLMKNGSSISCSEKSLGGIRIPDSISDIEFEIKKDEVEFILIVERYSVFHHLSQSDFHTKYKCIMVTGDGEPDMATRAFLKRLVDVTQLTAWALVNPDAHGVQTLCSYAFGPAKMSYASLGLAIPSIRWLGVLPGDLTSLTELDPMHFSNFSERGKKILKNLLKHNHLVIPNLWIQRIEQLLSEDVKASVESLHSLGFDYLGEVFVPKLLQVKTMKSH
ncbi:hypothetical protein ACP4OV_013352 [Aristida adscensionis]